MRMIVIIAGFLCILAIEAFADDRPMSGRLELTVEGALVNAQVLVDSIGITKDTQSHWNELPNFSFAFVQEGDVLLPVISGAIASDHPHWEWVLSPGTIISIKGGKSLSIPVALMEKNANCIHNGVLSLEISQENTPTKAHLHIASETCLYFKFDMTAKIDARWINELQENTTSIIANYMREKAHNFPVKPIDDLIMNYPDVDREDIAEFEHIKSENMSHFGVLLEGIHYVSGCQIRGGTYPHCDQMLMPSYSFAKSLVASFALMRLEKLYPGVGQLKTADYVPECHGEAWQDVRFIDALNMTTGNYHDTNPLTDEDSKAYQKLFLTKTHADKIKFSCEHFPHKTAPNKIFIYHTSDTYVLGTAINAFWRKKKGADADFFKDIIVKDIFDPLGLSASAKWTRRTYDDIAQPFTGWGLLLNRNDLAKLVWFLGDNNKEFQPKDIFSPAYFDASMQQNNDDRGKDVKQTFGPDSIGLVKYNKGFWAYNIKKKLRCDNDKWLPYLSGYGGLSAVILPHKMGFYNISDGGKYAFVNALYEINKIRSLCGETKQ